MKRVLILCHFDTLGREDLDVQLKEFCDNEHITDVYCLRSDSEYISELLRDKNITVRRFAKSKHLSRYLRNADIVYIATTNLLLFCYAGYARFSFDYKGIYFVRELSMISSISTVANKRLLTDFLSFSGYNVV